MYVLGFTQRWITLCLCTCVPGLEAVLTILTVILVLTSILCHSVAGSSDSARTEAGKDHKADLHIMAKGAGHSKSNLKDYVRQMVELYDLVEESPGNEGGGQVHSRQRTDEEEGKTSLLCETITCNGTEMVRERVTKATGQGWLYVCTYVRTCVLWRCYQKLIASSMEHASHLFPKVLKNRQRWRLRKTLCMMCTTLKRVRIWSWSSCSMCTRPHMCICKCYTVFTLFFLHAGFAVIGVHSRLFQNRN